MADESKSYTSGGAGYGAGAGAGGGESGAGGGGLDAPTIELEHAIGFAGCVPGGLRYHPNGRDFVYTAGGCVGECGVRCV